MRIDQLQPMPTDAVPLEIPAELLGSVTRHQANLAALVASLRAAGLPEELVESSVRTLMDSYVEELIVAIRGMVVEGRNHG